MKTLLLLMPVLIIRTMLSDGTLTVTILNFRNNLGQVSVALYNKEEAFPKSPDKAVKIIYAPIRDKKAVVVFESLPPGEYAISVFHDENKNGKMDTNFFGVPKEGVGASNNARGHLGPPHYKEAKFNFSGSIQSMSINLVYL
jgi:uncharacterized protein (DUF2141 family)